MTRDLWARFLRATSVAALTAFAVVTVVAPPDTGIAAFFNHWVYLGLMGLACAGALSGALLVRRDRAAWIVLTAGMAARTFGELWAAFAKPEGFPSLADVGFLAFYPLVYAGIVLLLRGMAMSLAGTLWIDGLIASSTADTAVLVGVVIETTQGSVATVATNLAYPLSDVLLLSAIVGAFSLLRWRPDRRFVLIGLGVLSAALADSAYLLRSASGTYVEGTWLDILWPAALLLMAAAAVHCRSARRRGRRARATAPRRPGRLRAARARRARVRPLPARQQPRLRPRRGDDARRRHSSRPDLAGEQPALRADPPRRSDRCVDGPREPAATGGGRLPAARAAERRSRSAHDLRPGRARGLQRHLRTPCRRCAARAPGWEARSGRGERGRRVPARVPP